MWFKKTKKILADLSVLKTDLHSHLLPAIDDGVQSTDEAINIIKRMQQLGYQKIITTPHVMSDTFRNTPESIKMLELHIKNALTENNIKIEFQAAAEYLVDDNFNSLIIEKKILTFGNNYILIELPFFTPPANLNNIIFDLQIAGFNIILAHPERYTYWHNNFNDYIDLKDKGIFFQINILSISGYYQQAVKKICEKMINEKIIDFVGTDTHNLKYIEHIEQSLSEKYLLKLLTSDQLKNHLL